MTDAFAARFVEGSASRIRAMMFVIAVMEKYMIVSMKIWRPTADFCMTRFGRSLKIVNAKTIVSKATEDPHEIGFHEGISLLRQFEAKGVCGPVTDAYCVATEIYHEVRKDQCVSSENHSPNKQA